MAPGAMLFTLILYGASSTAMTLVSSSRPAFADPYAARPLPPRCPDSEGILTILPPPDFTISRATACATRNAPVRLMPMIRFHSSRLVSRKGVLPPTSIVDENVDAVECVQDAGNHGRGGCRIGNIHGDRCSARHDHKRARDLAAQVLKDLP